MQHQPLRSLNILSEELVETKKEPQESFEYCSQKRHRCDDHVGSVNIYCHAMLKKSSPTRKYKTHKNTVIEMSRHLNCDER